MTSVSIREAKNRLTELARLVEAGERITVTRHGKPAFDLVPHVRKSGIDWEAGEAYLRSKGIERKPGESLFKIAPDFDDPLPEDFLITPITYPDEL
jgi:prevent-host-death family protein